VWLPYGAQLPAALAYTLYLSHEEQFYNLRSLDA
jgi:hypothetical protein